MDGPRDYHTKWSRIETNITWYHLKVESKKLHKWTYLKHRKRLTDLESKLMVTMGEESGEGLEVWNWHVHTAIFKTDNQPGLTV